MKKITLQELFLDENNMKEFRRKAESYKKQNRKFIVVIDPGHGGGDGGAINGKNKESDIVLRISLRAKEILEKEFSNVVVYLTRSTDVYLTLSYRSRFSNSKKADMFISVHLNAASPQAHGYESFTSRGSGSTSNALTGHVHNACVKTLVNNRGFANRGRKRENFAVLYNTYAPAILTENLFISNNSELRYLLNGGIEEVARAHAEGIASAFKLPRKAQSKPTIIPPKVSVSGGDKMYTPTKTLTNSTLKVLSRLEEKGLSSSWREKLAKGELTTNEAVGLLFVAVERGYL